ITGTPQTVRVVYVHGAYTLASANFGEIGPGPSQTSVTPTATSAPAPVVTGITPSAGIAGSTVSGASVTGANFQSGATVRLTRSGYPDIPGTSVVFVSANQLTSSFSLAGAAAGQYTVVVRNPDGQTGTPLTNGFTVSNAAPTVTAISPVAAYSGVPVQIDSITGTNFLSGATVQLHRGTSTITASNVTVVSPTRISCTADLLGAATGQWNVTVSNPDLQSGTGTNLFTIQPALPPTISSITPNSGNRGWNVSITNLAGANFQQGATVQLRRGAATITATNVTVVSSSQITCTFDLSGAATGLWDVRVINPDAQAGTATGIFTVYSPAPAISGITPNTYVRGWPVQISALTGSNFQPGATVELRRSGSTTITATNVTVVSASLITCTFDLSAVPTGSWNTQAWDVRVTNTDTQFSTATGIFTVTNYVPTISQIVPNSARRYETFTATVTGTGFQPGVTAVQLRRSGTTISGSSITVVSPTQLTCTFTIPYNAPVNTDYTVRVTNPGSRSGTSDSLFSVTAAPAPAITGITPASGARGWPVTITNLAGSGFAPGATVQLQRSGSTSITGTGVTVVSPSQITCTFNLAGVTAGTWNVYVRNTDGQSATASGIFTVTNAAPVVTGINPTEGRHGTTVSPVIVSGSSFQPGARVSLYRGATSLYTAPAGTVTADQITTSFAVGSGVTPGLADVRVTNPDGQYFTLPNAYTILT
ncbi:hypothetical protein, partial [Methanoregula sp. PtaB.Bin085]|uniref:hypothetical protein n=1 Tax=Methanoregula sp. PtaB.Bin085 TaxID=1811680 RepID=UPI0025E9DAEF